MNKNIFITGGTGYIGSRLIPLLAERGYKVKALVRNGSENKLNGKCEIIIGDALDYKTFVESIAPCEIFIHLVGVSHPGPQKAKLFRLIDLESIKQSVEAAKKAGIKYFIYLSVAQHAPIMKEYQKVRSEGEEL